MQTLFVRPAPGARVRDPDTKAPIPADGAVVPDNGYWRRRLRVGDVVLVVETAHAPSKSKE